MLGVDERGARDSSETVNVVGLVFSWCVLYGLRWEIFLNCIEFGR